MLRSITRPLRIVYLSLFLFYLHSAFTLYVNSSFLSDGCGCGIPESVVGIIFTLGNAISLALLSELPRIAQKFGNRALMLVLLIINTLALLGIMFVGHTELLAILMIIYLALNAVIMMSFDIFLEEYSDDGATGDVRGIFVSLTHVALATAPFIAGILIERSNGYFVIYGIGLTLSIITLLVFLANYKTFKNPIFTRTTILDTIRSFWHDLNLRKIFLASFLLQFFFAIMVIYTPIYLNQYIGIEWDKIGIIISIMLIPYILFAIPLGDLADRKFGETEILSLGFVTTALFTIAFGFLTTDNWIIWALVLFGTRLGGTAIQTMTDSYFFKHVNESDVSSISLFRDANPLAYMIAPLTATFILTSFGVPLQYIFVILGLVMFLGLRYSLTIEDTK